MVPVPDLMRQNPHHFLIFQTRKQRLVNCDKVEVSYPVVLSTVHVVLSVDLDFDVSCRKAGLDN